MRLNEISTAKLDQYTKAADTDYTTASAEGDYKKSFKRASGMMKASGKKIDNDVKAMQKARGVAEGVNHSALQGWDEMTRDQKRDALDKAGIVDSHKTYSMKPEQLDDILHAAKVKAQNQEDELSMGAGGRRELQRQAKQDFEAQRQQLHKEKMEMERFAWEKANTEAERKHEIAKIEKEYLHDLRKLQMGHQQDMEKILHADTHELNKMKAEFNMRQAEREKDNVQVPPQQAAPQEPDDESGNNYDQDTGEPLKPTYQQYNAPAQAVLSNTKPPKPSKYDNDDVTDVEPKPNKPFSLKEKITVVKDPADATSIQQTGGITQGSVYAGKPLPQSLQQKLDGKTNTARAVDAKGRTQQQWMKLVKAKFPDAKIMQSKMFNGPVFAMLSDGRKLSWNKVEQGVAEDNLQEVAPLIAAAARFIVPTVLRLMPRIGKILKSAPTVIGKAATKSAPAVGKVAQTGAEIVGRNAGAIGTGAGVYTALTTIADGLVGGVGEVYDDVTDAVNELTDKLGDALDTTTITSLAAAAVKYSIPIGIVLAMLYGGKKVIDKMISEQGMAEGSDWHGSDTDRDWYDGYKDAPVRVKVKNISGMGGQPSGTYTVRSFTKVGPNNAEFTVNSQGREMTASLDLDNPRTYIDKKYDKQYAYDFYSGRMPITPRQAFNLIQVKKQPSNIGKKGVAEGSEWETRHNEFVTVGDKATPEQINKIVKALVGAAQQAGSKRGVVNSIFGKQSNGDLARMAHGADTLAKNIQKNSNAKPGTDERKELGQHLVNAVSLLKRISGKQGVAEDKAGWSIKGSAKPAPKGPAPSWRLNPDGTSTDKNTGITYNRDGSVKAEQGVAEVSTRSEVLAKRAAWQKTPLASNKMVIDGYTINFTPTALVISRGGKVLWKKEGNYSQPTNSTLVGAKKLVTGLSTQGQPDENQMFGKVDPAELKARKEHRLKQQQAYTLSSEKKISFQQAWLQLFGEDLEEGQFDLINDDDFYEYNVDSKEIVARTSVKAPTARALTPNKSMEWPGRDDKHKITKGFKAKSLKK